MPKYVNPNSFTFSSRAAHWARESGSEINDSTEVKFLRETVLYCYRQYQNSSPVKIKRTHGTLWSTVARVQSLLRTGLPALRLPQKCQLVNPPNDRMTTNLQSLESLRTRYFVHQMTTIPVEFKFIRPRRALTDRYIRALNRLLSRRYSKRKDIRPRFNAAARSISLTRRDHPKFCHTMCGELGLQLAFR